MTITPGPMRGAVVGSSGAGHMGVCVWVARAARTQEPLLCGFSGLFLELSVILVRHTHPQIPSRPL